MSNVFTPGPGGSWIPGVHARGPFEGVQGGAVAALMLEQIVRIHAGFPASIATHFLKPTPLAPLSASVHPLRLGRRVSVVDAELEGPEGLVAVQRTTLIATRQDARLPVAPHSRVDPTTFPAEQRSAAHGGPWFMDTMDARRGSDGRFWFRQTAPIFHGASDLARVLAAADWAHGLTPPMGADVRPPAAIPNTDLSVHLIRRPRGAWIGVEAATAWSADSIGAGWAMLHDGDGVIGRVAMSVAVTLLLETAL